MASLGEQFQKDADRAVKLMADKERLLAHLEVTKTGAWEVFARQCKIEIASLDRKQTSLPEEVMESHGRVCYRLGRISGMKEILSWFADPSTAIETKLKTITKELDRLHKGARSKAKALGGASI